jgi:hypothetical protein
MEAETDIQTWNVLSRITIICADLNHVGVIYNPSGTMKMPGAGALQNLSATEMHNPFPETRVSITGEANAGIKWP